MRIPILYEKRSKHVLGIRIGAHFSVPGCDGDLNCCIFLRTFSSKCNIVAVEIVDKGLLTVYNRVDDPLDVGLGSMAGLLVLRLTLLRSIDEV